MKHLFTLLFAFSFLFSLGQASSSSEFQLKVSFEKSIPVDELEVKYELRSGNHIEEVAYELDIENNAIIIKGYNSYVLWVPFPTLVFTLNEEYELKDSNQEAQKQTSFYLISEVPLSSFTGEQTQKIYFSLERPIVIASLEIHNHDDAFDKMKLRSDMVFKGHSYPLSLSMEMMTVPRKEND